MKIIWKQNDMGGSNGYVGLIKVASYHYNGIDHKNGQYKGRSFLPQSNLSFKHDDENEIKRLVEKDVTEFLEKLNK